jgi:2Fe-2S ferredoxin
VVRVEPLGVAFSVDPGETLLQAAWRAGLDWPTLCYGQAECMACRIEVISGHDSIVAADEAEVAAMRSRLPPSQTGSDVRLACRLRLNGPTEVVVRKRGVRRSRGGSDD